ncbi:MAG: hypothetical protein JSR76_01155 [Verrucomicrobia bacterium]|nr:hypothetical protein [Verrucomicrobiota bacterium]
MTVAPHLFLITAAAIAVSAHALVSLIATQDHVIVHAVASALHKKALVKDVSNRRAV